MPVPNTILYVCIHIKNYTIIFRSDDRSEKLRRIRRRENSSRCNYFRTFEGKTAGALTKIDFLANESQWGPIRPSNRREQNVARAFEEGRQRTFRTPTNELWRGGGGGWSTTVGWETLKINRFPLDSIFNHGRHRWLDDDGKCEPTERRENPPEQSCVRERGWSEKPRVWDLVEEKDPREKRPFPRRSYRRGAFCAAHSKTLKIMRSNANSSILNHGPQLLRHGKKHRV